MNKTQKITPDLFLKISRVLQDLSLRFPSINTEMSYQTGRGKPFKSYTLEPQKKNSVSSLILETIFINIQFLEFVPVKKDWVKDPLVIQEGMSASDMVYAMITDKETKPEPVSVFTQDIQSDIFTYLQFVGAGFIEMNMYEKGFQIGFALSTETVFESKDNILVHTPGVMSYTLTIGAKYFLGETKYNSMVNLKERTLYQIEIGKHTNFQYRFYFEDEEGNHVVIESFTRGHCGEEQPILHRLDHAIIMDGRLNFQKAMIKLCSHELNMYECESEFSEKILKLTAKVAQNQF